MQPTSQRCIVRPCIVRPWRGLVTAGLLVLGLTSPLWCETALSPAETRGDAAFRQRAAGFTDGGHLDPRHAETAVVSYDEALAQDPTNLRLHFKLLEALYFRAWFVTEDAKVRSRIYERMVGLCDQALAEVERRGSGGDAVPEAVDAHFWTAISWGLWGMSHSKLSAVSKGVAPRIRDHAQAVVRLDEAYADAGGLRLLGRLHTATPRVFFVTGWIDRQEGLALLRRATEISHHDPRNPLFLAEALLDGRGDREEALALLREVARRRPDPDAVVEQTETIERARELLAELDGRS